MSKSNKQPPTESISSSKFGFWEIEERCRMRGDRDDNDRDVPSSLNHDEEVPRRTSRVSDGTVIWSGLAALITIYTIASAQTQCGLAPCGAFPYVAECQPGVAGTAQRRTFNRGYNNRRKYVAPKAATERWEIFGIKTIPMTIIRHR